ncbi:glycosyltransferase family 2 protein [Desulfohalovibrio reitneri]|uniref:glycosyltransferase family 2 protein n=1 Tax=Desulfohalovibrio reitneri TaxID=1307759 RepID=UPI0004A78450|nr:glycosyltransferase [Desulfohalovibrio reitneri]
MADLVSVLMACYNGEKYLEESILTVLNQTYRDLEFFIMDDGSTDGSREVMEKYADRLTVLEHPGRGNRGQYYSLNEALRHARGKYVAFIDADDLWEPDKIEKQVALMRRTGRKFCYTAVKGFHGDDMDRWFSFTDKDGPLATAEAILLDCGICPAATMVERSALEDVGGFAEDVMPGDHDFFLRVLERHPACFLREYATWYRFHPAQISAKRVLWEDGFAVLRRAAGRYPYGRRLVRKRKAVLYYRLMRHDLRDKKPRFLYYALLSFLYDTKRAAGHALGALRKRMRGTPPGVRQGGAA